MATQDSRPEDMPEGGHAPDTDVRDSDPNAEQMSGSGGMGVSSERTDEEGEAYGVKRTDEQERDEDADVPPEQSSDPATGEPIQGSPSGPNEPHVPGGPLGT